VAWILAVKRVLTKRGAPINVLQAEHMKEGQIAIIKYVQRCAFPNGVETSSLKGLQPIMMDGLLRVGGRLKNAPVPDHFKCPAILPGDSGVVDLLVQQAHVA
jgi:hypothetical protein